MTEYFYFEDGKGYVPAHRHPNGGGWVADTAYVAPSAYVAFNAKVFNYAEVHGDVVISDCARISNYSRISGEIIISNYSRVSGIQRSDGYTFIYVPDADGVMKVQAGCRDFTMKEAKIHWIVTRGGTPLGDETMEILKFLKRLSKVKPERCV